MSCHAPPPRLKLASGEYPPIKVALVGNANVGKSVIFNQLTGLNQTVGNWPGKTVTWAEGLATFCGQKFELVDLPGIYSLSTYSLEEVVTREYIVEKHPDFIVDVLDASNLERNLFLTLQLLLLHEGPIIVVLNQWDLAKSKGLAIDIDKLSEILGCPVIPTVAVHSRGVHEILETIFDLQDHPDKFSTPTIRLGKEVETRMDSLEPLLPTEENLYPARFAALKLLESDKEMLKYYESRNPDAIALAEQDTQELEELHGEKIAAIVSGELYSIVHHVVDVVQVIEHPIEKESLADRLDHVTTHSVWGYVILIGILVGMYTGVFSLGGFIATVVDALYQFLSTLVYGAFGTGTLVQVLWNGGMGGFLGAVGGVLPFVFIFYFFLEILQDSGYLPRAAFMMDSLMHRIGLHGKSIIPLILGFGCNVPGCSACRIMETEREKNLSMFITTIVPCAARTTVVMGLVGHYLGFNWALLLYLINFAVIIVMGRIAYKLVKGEKTELIIELHDYRKPNLNVIAKQTWFRGKEFVYRALPLIVVFGILLQLLIYFNALNPINEFLSPVTVAWLGLPVGVGIFLLYGIFRKELTLVLLANFVMALGLTIPQYMTPLQMMVFALITMLYIPCMATIIVVGKEAGWKIAAYITIVEICVALLMGGLINWIMFFIQGIVH
ncbi:MAG TPA: ferrous iron transport protein B [Candidatus Lokiarchaeia archaeon]|nr:ferrous iron transport protein B [Candidatus Lokiarchaeia archaeon]